MVVFLSAIGVALVVSFLCSIFESVLLTLNHAQVEALEREGKPAGRILKDFKRNIDVPIAAILIANTVAHTIGASVAGASYGEVFDEDTLWIFTIVFTIAVLLFTEIIPKTLGVTKAPALATPVAYGIQGLTLALRPLVAASELISRNLRKGEENPVTSIEEIRLLATLGGSEGVVGSRTARMIVGATRLRDLSARHVMVPRRDITFISGAKSLDEALATLTESGHSRFPFSPTGEVDDISGIVLAKNLLFALRDHPSRDINWDDQLQPPLIVPESKSLNNLLRTFQELRTHMAVVVNEHGGVEGIVTLEDVLEEIVGEIIDESDHFSEDVARQPDGSLQVDASLEMRKICEHFEIDWDSDAHITSLGGLVSEQLGRLPVAGDELTWNGLQIRVLSANPRRAKKIAIERVPEPPVETDGES